MRTTLLILISVLLFGCNNTEKKDDIEWEKIKKNREGLDQASINDNLFRDIDTVLMEWHNAQKLRDHGNIHAAESKLRDLSRDNFSILVGALTGDDYESQVIASASLGFCEDIRALPYLVEALENGNAQVRSNSAMSIGSIGFIETEKEKIFAALKKEQDEEVRGMLYFAISRTINPEEDKEAVKILVEGLKDENLQVRNHSLIALSVVGDMEVAKNIVGTTLNDEDPTIRYNSVRTIGRIGDSTFLEPIKEKLEDPVLPVRKMAAFVVKKWTGEENDVEFLKKKDEKKDQVSE